MTLLIGVAIEILLIGLHLFMEIVAKRLGHISATVNLHGGVGLFVMSSVLFATAVGWFATEIVMKKLGLVYQAGLFAGILSLLHAVTVLFISMTWLLHLIGVYVVFAFIYLLFQWI